MGRETSAAALRSEVGEAPLGTAGKGRQDAEALAAGGGGTKEQWLAGSKHRGLREAA